MKNSDIKDFQTLNIGDTVYYANTQWSSPLNNYMPEVENIIINSVYPDSSFITINCSNYPYFEIFQNKQTCLKTWFERRLFEIEKIKKLYTFFLDEINQENGENL